MNADLFVMINNLDKIFQSQDINIEDFLPEDDVETQLQVPSVIVPEIQVPLDARSRRQIEDMLPGHSLRLEEAQELYLTLRRHFLRHGIE